MATEINPMYDYGAMMAHGAAIPGDIAKQWADQHLTQEQATGVNLENQRKRLKLPLLRAAINDYMTAPENNYDTAANQSFDTDNIPAVNKDQIGSDAQPTRDQPAPTLVPNNPGIPANLATTAAISQQTNAAGVQDADTASQGTAPQGQGTSAPVDPATKRKQIITEHQEGLAAQTLAPVPTALPANSKKGKLYAALMIAGEPEAAEGVKTSWEQGALAENQTRQKLAKQSFATARDAVEGYKQGQSIKAILAQNYPATYAKLKHLSEEQLYEHFEPMLASTHQYTGRGLTLRDDGIVVDTPTGEPIPGFDHRVGMSVAQDADFRVRLSSPTYDVNMGHGPVKVSLLDWTNKMRTNRGQSTLTPDQLHDEILGKAAQTGRPVDEITNNMAQSMGATPSVSPTTTGSAGQSRITTSANAASASKNAGLSNNSADGYLDLTKFSPKPSFLPQGFNSGEGNTGDKANADLYAHAEQTKKAEASIDAAKDSAAINNNKTILRNMEGSELGPASTGVSLAQNVLEELFHNRTIGDIRKTDPAKFNILNKLLTQAATKNVTNMTDQTRVSAALFGFGSNISANVNQNRRAIEYLIKYDTALHEYSRVKNSTFSDISDKIDINNFEGQYTAANSPSKLVPLYMDSIDKNGDINRRQGSPINPYRVTTPAEVAKLPPGVVFMRPDGSLHTTKRRHQ